MKEKKTGTWKIWVVTIFLFAIVVAATIRGKYASGAEFYGKGEQGAYCDRSGARRF